MKVRTLLRLPRSDAIMRLISTIRFHTHVTSMKLVRPSITQVTRFSPGTPPLGYAVSFTIEGIRGAVAPLREKLRDKLSEAGLYDGNCDTLLVSELPDPVERSSEVASPAYGDYTRAQKALGIAEPAARASREDIWPVRLHYVSRPFATEEEAHRVRQQLSDTLTGLAREAGGQAPTR